MGEEIIKIIATVVGLSVVGYGISRLINELGSDSSGSSESDDGNDTETAEPLDYVETYDNNSEMAIQPGYTELQNYDTEEEEDYIIYAQDIMPDYDNEDIFTEEQHNALNSIQNDLDTAQKDMNTSDYYNNQELLYLDFITNYTTISNNRNDAYQEPLDEQYRKIQRRISLNGKNIPMDFSKFVRLCFPSIKSTYYLSMPSFKREITQKQHYSVMNNLVIRVENTGIVSSVIPEHLDVMLIGDLFFRNNIISFTVKGIDLVDTNVEKFGELKIECTAVCATSRNEMNLPDYGLRGSDMYRSFLTRDKIMSFCRNVYPIEHPENAIRVFEEWKDYVKFRDYYLQVQSMRNEGIDSVSFIKAYIISKNEYRNNEDEYSNYLLDGNKSFDQKDQVILDCEVDDAVEIVLAKVELTKNLFEINQHMARGNKISTFEIGLRSFTRNSVALSKIDPARMAKDVSYDNFIFLGDRIAFVYEDILPDSKDIEAIYEKKIASSAAQIEDKFSAIVKAVIEEFRIEIESKLSAEINAEIEENNSMLDSKLDDDVKNNTDTAILKKYNEERNRISHKYTKMRKQVKKDKEKLGHSFAGNSTYEEIIQQLSDDEVTEISQISVRDMYIERNNLLKREFEKSKQQYKKRRLDELCAEKERLLYLELSKPMDRKKQAKKAALIKERDKEIAERNRTLTDRHYCIYFKIEDIEPDTIKPEQIQLYKFLAYDSRAEKKKIERQQRAIESFFCGYVKNPFLSSYFFEPESLSGAEHEIDAIEWFLTRLNDTQKAAVRKALSSNSLFLLQGPPGTGKTEVIAEITAQYIRQGKKVLISSETHKAIDNVFERLPKIPEIRPIRLIPSMSGKFSEYSPEKLVDNMYISISSMLDKRIKRYENFSEMKDSFSDKLAELGFCNGQVLKLEQKCHEVQSEKGKIQHQISAKDALIESKRSIIRPLHEEKAQYNYLLTCIDKKSFSEKIEKSEVLSEICSSIFEIVNSYNLFGDADVKKAIAVADLDIDKVRSEFKTIEENDGALSIEQEKASIKAQMQALRDPDTLDILSGKEDEYNELRKKLIALKNAPEQNNNIDFSTFAIAGIVSADKISTSIGRSNVLQVIIEIQSKISDLVANKKKEVQSVVDSISDRISSVEGEISRIKAEKNELIIHNERLNSDESYIEYRNKRQWLRKLIVEFFTDFEINDEYPADDFSMAIEIINRKWNDIERNQEALEKENQSKIPIYKSIRDYLRNEDILEADRVSYTKKLFDNANVFGMTCTSREYYNESSIKALKEYNLGNINVKNVGIDVVIIDEVSKSSFLDLLIPILYGKTVILVGDHRQLPPMYDLKHLRASDMSCMDPSIIDLAKNKQYQKLYETCFFKSLFESVPDDFKIMLDRQYRCHSDIMDVFNHFYGVDGTGLKIGLSNQNDLKQHGLMIKHNDVTIIEPNNHIYFVNCTEYESKYDSDSVSIINRQEADVVAKLLELIDGQYGKMIKSGEIKVTKEKDNRKSVGVICTYRDQARQIKNLLKGKKMKHIAEKREERFIVNTVDDFQGDERDIIIVSMVRNPRGHNYSTEFIDQFERINVALSRARCMLIIVGSQDFLSRSSIDLPDINGHKELDRHSFPIYKEIIRTIQAKGKILQATDILGEVTKHGK